MSPRGPPPGPRAAEPVAVPRNALVEETPHALVLIRPRRRSHRPPRPPLAGSPPAVPLRGAVRRDAALEDRRHPCPDRVDDAGVGRRGRGRWWRPRSPARTTDPARRRRRRRRRRSPGSPASPPRRTSRITVRGEDERGQGPVRRLGGVRTGVTRGERRSVGLGVDVRRAGRHLRGPLRQCAADRLGAVAGLAHEPRPKARGALSGERDHGVTAPRVGGGERGAGIEA